MVQNFEGWVNYRVITEDHWFAWSKTHPCFKSASLRTVNVRYVALQGYTPKWMCT